MTEEEIVKSFAAQMAEAPDELAKLKLEAQMHREIAGLRRSELQQRDVASWRAEILGKYPRARQDEVRGETREELEAAAKASHDFVEAAIAAEKERIEAEMAQKVGLQVYGTPGAGSAGGPPPTSPDAFLKLRADLETKRMNGGTITQHEEDQLLQGFMGGFFDEDEVADIANRTATPPGTPAAPR